MLSSLQFLVFIALALGSLICLGVSAIFGGDHGDMGGHAEAGEHGMEHDAGEAAPSFFSPRAFLPSPLVSVRLEP